MEEKKIKKKKAERKMLIDLNLLREVALKTIHLWESCGIYTTLELGLLVDELYRAVDLVEEDNKNYITFDKCFKKPDYFG